MQSARIAICDLAIHDPEVVEAHHASNLVIAGRHGTVFRNAFSVKVPISSDAILRVWSPLEQPDFPDPQVSLEDVTFSTLSPNPTLR
jgi:hypothetical protein